MDHTKKIPHRANKKEIAAWYGISVKTLITEWLPKIPDLGQPKFKRGGYSREQLLKIFRHLEPPDSFDVQKMETEDNEHETR